MIKTVIISLLLVCQVIFAAPKEIVLTPQNSVVLSGSLNPIVLASVAFGIEVTRALVPEQEPIYLVIFSPGGMVQGCDVMWEELNTIPGLEVVIVFAGSAAALISQAPGVKRNMYAHGALLFHQVRVSIPSLVDALTLSQILEDLKDSTDEFDRLCHNRLKMTFADYKQKVEGKDWILRGQEALDVGAADELVEVRCSPAYEKNNPVVDATNPKNPKRLCQVIKEVEKRSHGTKPTPKTK